MIRKSLYSLYKIKAYYALFYISCAIFIHAIEIKSRNTLNNFSCSSVHWSDWEKSLIASNQWTNLSESWIKMPKENKLSLLRQFLRRQFFGDLPVVSFIAIFLLIQINSLFKLNRDFGNTSRIKYAPFEAWGNECFWVMKQSFYA